MPLQRSLSCFSHGKRNKPPTSVSVSPHPPLHLSLFNPICCLSTLVPALETSLPGQFLCCTPEGRTVRLHAPLLDQRPVLPKAWLVKLMVIHPLQLIKLRVHLGYTISRQLLTVHVGIQNHAPLLPGICNTSQFLWLLPLLLAPLATSHPRASSVYDGPHPPRLSTETQTESSKLGHQEGQSNSSCPALGDSYRVAT